MLGLSLLVFVPLFQAASEEPMQQERLKVYISADMEGVAGIVHWDETELGKGEYNLFRKLMTEEVNAAIDGALRAGATEILVRDAHWTARNLIPDLLREEAMLIRGWNTGPLGMMDGLDETFDAAILIGEHDRAGTVFSPLAHTMTGSFFSVYLNGEEMSESSLAAVVAGHFDVPIVMVSGDTKLCEEMKDLLGRLETAQVREGLGRAVKSMHPKRARKLIEEKTLAALQELDSFSPYKVEPPYTLEIICKDAVAANMAAWVPGAKREGGRKVVFSHPDLMEVLSRLRLAIQSVHSAL